MTQVEVSKVQAYALLGPTPDAVSIAKVQAYAVLTPAPLVYTEGEAVELKAPGTFSGTVSSTSYQWQRSDDGDSGWTDITGETGATYTLHADDVGKWVGLLQTATNAGGSTSARSNVIGAVEAA
jgi:hypothetical protein